jgi:hypothetical protein
MLPVKRWFFDLFASGSRENRHTCFLFLNRFHRLLCNSRNHVNNEPERRLIAQLRFSLRIVDLVRFFCANF